MASGTLGRARLYLMGTRFPFVTASLLPALIGPAWAWARGMEVELAGAAIGCAGVVFLHLGANTINDYFDWDATDKVNRFANAFSGGSRYRLEGLLGRGAFLSMAIAFFLLAAALGGLLALLGRPWVIPIGVCGALCGIVYSAYPLSFQARGLGEATIFLAFGPLITLGMGYAACGAWSADFFLVGIPNGFVVANILWINEFPDLEADRQAGKRNLVVRLGTAGARWIHAALHVLLYVSVVLLWAAGRYPAWSLLVLVTLPLAAKGTARAWRSHADPRAIVPAQAMTIQLQAASAVVLLLSLALSKLL